MAESKRRPRGLKGAVLIMVITILFVLIVMLLATLAVVSSTTQRTYTKYEETQAYYTARSVLEVYIDEVLSSSEPYNIDKDSHGTDTNEKLIMDAMKAGGFETIKYLDEDGVTVYDGLAVKVEKDGSGNVIDTYKVDFANEKIEQGFAHQQEIFGYLRPKYEWNPSSSAPGTDKPSDDRNWKHVEANDDECYVIYESTLPEISGVANVKKESMDTDGKVQVKVELLRVLYRNSAGKIISDNVNYSDVSGIGHMSTLKSDVDTCVDWKQTYYRLKVTSTANLEEHSPSGEVLSNEVSVSVILEPKDVPSPKGFLNAMTSLSKLDTNNHLFAIGGASADHPDPSYSLSYRQNNMIHGDCVFRSNFFWETGSDNQWVLDNPYNSFVIEGGVMWSGDQQMKLVGMKTLNSSGTGYLSENWDQSALTAEQVKQRPFVYTSGIVVNGYIGKADQACDIICTKSGAFSNIKTKAYQWMPTGSDEDTLLFGCGGNACTVYGDIYCDSDMFIHGNTTNIYGNVYCTGTLYVQDTNKKYFHGDVYCGTLKDSGGNAVASGDTMLDDTTRTFSIGATLPASYGLPTSDKKTVEKITLPSISKKGEVQVTRTEALAQVYTYDDYKKTPPPGKTGGDLLTAVEMFETTAQKSGLSLKCDGATNLWSAIGTATAPIADDYITVSNTSLIIPASAGTDIGGMASFVMDFNNTPGGNYNDTYYIDATSKDVHIELKGSSANSRPVFVVVGKNAVYITQDENTSCSVAFGMYSSQIYQMYKNGDKFYFGNSEKVEVKDTPKAPQIYYYFGEGSKLTLSNTTADRLQCGYMYGPYAEFGVTSGFPDHQVQYRYEQGTLNPNTAHNVGLFGSMVFGNIKTDNEYGVCYISNDDDSASGGAGTNIAWSKQRYLNS